MGKILLIEPEIIILQALRFFLFANHELETLEGMKDISEEKLRGYDLLIIDGSSLREFSKLTDEKFQIIQRCSMPVIWLQNKEEKQPSSTENLFCLMKPLELIELRNTLDGLLSRSNIQGPGNALVREISKGKSERKRSSKSDMEIESPIDLVEVVEVEGSQEQLNGEEKKSR